MEVEKYVDHENVRIFVKEEKTYHQDQGQFWQVTYFLWIESWKPQDSRIDE